MSEDTSLFGSNNSGGWGVGAFVIIFFIIALMGGGNGFFGNNARGETATTADIQRAVDLGSLQQGQKDIEAVVRSTGADAISALKDASYNNLGEIRDLQAEVGRENNATQTMISNGFANMQTCCCGLDKSILENRYLAEKNTADIIAAVHADGEATRTMYQQDKIAQLQNEVNTLQMQNAIATATAGVVKYPSASTYYAGMNPFCGGGCNCAYAN